ncbi:energy-coupling factor transporter transmembrane component T family protein [Nonomuraea polychroma]|uniref:energy-coupling factor transporter transmembrane component T family protein n=1 Tax=Nonomuraea polychroma TaxID=46176 RepID=UPI003D8A44C8
MTVRDPAAGQHQRIGEPLHGQAESGIEQPRHEQAESGAEQPRPSPTEPPDRPAARPADRPATRRAFLARLNPLAKIAATLPAMFFLLLVRDPWTPGLFAVAALALVWAAGGVRPRWSLVVVPFALMWFTLVFALLAAEHVAAGTPVVLLGLRAGALEYGLATTLRILALLSLALLGGVGTTGPDLVRALVQQLRVPYRFAYGALAALRFVPRFSHELEVIRAAHRVRGVAEGRGPLGQVRRTGRMLIPLQASAIRHAERVSLAMDARAFGAHPTRTEREVLRFGRAEALFVVACWAVSVLLAAAVVVSGQLRLLTSFHL